MTPYAAQFWSLIVETAVAPQSAARRLMAWSLPLEPRLIAIALAAVLSVLSLVLSVLVSPLGSSNAVFTAMLNPWVGVPLQILSQLILAAVMTVSGRAQGGTGRFWDASILVAWMQILLAIGQIVQTALFIVLPVLSLPLALGIFSLFIWVTTNFTAALHGFTNLLKTFGALLLTFFLTMIALAVLLSVFGVIQPPSEITNV